MGKVLPNGLPLKRKHDLSDVLTFVYLSNPDKPSSQISKDEWKALVDTIRICKKTLDRYEKEEKFQDDGK